MSPAGEGQREENTLALGMRHGPDLKGLQSVETRLLTPRRDPST